jgi:apolipoprotein N-acyltransferase
MRYTFGLKEISLLLLSVVLYRLMLPNFNFPEIAYVFAVPLLVWACFNPPKKTYYSVSAGVCFLNWVSTIFWLRHITWVGLILLSVVLGFLMWVWWVSVYRVLGRILYLSTIRRILCAIGLAGLWVLIEWVRSFLFTGFPWLPLAASQWQRPAALQLAEYTGAYGVSFIIIFFNIAIALCIAQFFKNKKPGCACFVRMCPEFYCALLLLLGNTFLYTSALRKSVEEESLFSVAWVQPYVPASLKWSETEANKHIQVLELLTQHAALGRPDLILWPESCTPYPVYGDYRMEAWVDAFSERIEAPILMGNVAVTPTGWYNGIFFVSDEWGIAPEFYAKLKRVPFGEYIPLREYLPSWVTKVIPLEEDIQTDASYETLGLLVKNRPYQAAGLVCYEDIFPQVCRKQVMLGADFIYVVTNDGWYLEEAGAYQHAAHSVLRAVESRRPVLRCGNNGWSGWMDELGRTRFVLEDAAGSIYIRDTAQKEISRSPIWASHLSIYTVYGDWFIGLCSVFVVLGLIQIRKVQNE